MIGRVRRWNGCDPSEIGCKHIWTWRGDIHGIVISAARGGWGCGFYRFVTERGGRLYTRGAGGKGGGAWRRFYSPQRCSGHREAPDGAVFIHHRCAVDAEGLPWRTRGVLVNNINLTPKFPARGRYRHIPQHRFQNVKLWLHFEALLIMWHKLL